MSRTFVERGCPGILLGLAKVQFRSTRPPLVGTLRTSEIVKGFRMPARHRREGVHGGRRPKSLEGGNRRGELAPTLVSVYGEFVAAA